MLRHRSIVRTALKVLRCAAVTLAMPGLLLPSGCNVTPPSDSLCESAGNLGQKGAFVGAVAESAALIAFDVTPCTNGDRLRAFVTDGAPDGDSEFFEGPAGDGQFGFDSKSGQARIDGVLTDAGVTGTIRLADGVERAFSALPATDGAGLYEVKVDTAGTWTGTGPAGATLEARQDDKLVSGVLKDASGEHPYLLRDLSRTFAEPVVGGEADDYMLIVLPHSDSQVGRGGAASLKAGSAIASTNFIRLDLLASQNPTPGTFVGRFQDLPDLIGLEFDEPDAAGNTHVRIFVCDGQPAPNGRAEWFSADFPGEFPDAAFTADSISGNARIRDLALKNPQLSEEKASIRSARRSCDGGTWCCSGECAGCCSCCAGIAGMLELADGSPHQFYAVPVGEGAGIYEVRLSPDGMRGTSIQGGTLDLSITDGRVTGSFTTPDGIVIPYEALDLGGAFSDPATLATVSDTFVVLVAPRGRFIVGSPGNAHGLVVIAIIAVLIGLLVPAVQKVR